MRTFISVLVLIFSLQSLANADDIRDFQIEGMSIGDSALNFFTTTQINNNKRNYFKSKKFTPVQNDNLSFFQTYDAVDFIFKTGDENYIIHSLSGVLKYENNIEECYQKMDEIVSEMDSLFKFAKKYPKSSYKHQNDKTQKSIVTDVDYVFNNGDTVVVACYDYSEAHGGQDHLSVAIDTNEIYNFFINEAYK